MACIDNGIFYKKSRFFSSKWDFFENKFENIEKISKNILKKFRKHSIILYRVFFMIPYEWEMTEK